LGRIEAAIHHDKRIRAPQKSRARWLEIRLAEI